MIIYGHNSTDIFSRIIPDRCPNCDSQNTLRMRVQAVYAHIFWIPLFPYKRKRFTECEHCKQHLPFAFWSRDVQNRYYHHQKDIKNPLWTFSGLGVIAALIVVGIIDSHNEKIDSSDYIAKPKKGDIYDFKVEGSGYTLVKVIGTRPDSIQLVMNEYESTMRSGLRKLVDSPYQKDVVNIARKDLKNLFNKKNILRVRRD